jgi:hypothetical protein
MMKRRPEVSNSVIVCMLSLLPRLAHRMNDGRSARGMVNRTGTARAVSRIGIPPRAPDRVIGSDGVINMKALI